MLWYVSILHSFCGWIVFYCVDVSHIYPSIHLVCLYFLAVMNDATMNISIHVFISLGYISRHGIAGSYDNSTFKLLRSC